MTWQSHLLQQARVYLAGIFKVNPLKKPPEPKLLPRQRRRESRLKKRGFAQ
jgi:hypothetical protein